MTYVRSDVVLLLTVTAAAAWHVVRFAHARSLVSVEGVDSYSAAG